MKSNLGFPLVRLSIRVEQDIVSARQKTRQLAALLGFDQQDQARIATAVSELARNAYQYAKAGTAELFFQEPRTLFIRISDEGPGIENWDVIDQGAYVSKTGMGIGITGTRKLMDHFEVMTGPKGTAITIGKNLSRGAQAMDLARIEKVLREFSSRKVENTYEEVQVQNRELLRALEDVESARFELVALNQELSETNRGVVALYAELDEKAASLQRANEVKTSFLSNMTHEFRTPLSSIISLTRILSSRIDGDLTAEQAKQVNYIASSATSLLELVNDLLDLAKVEAGKISLSASEFDAEEVLGALRGVFRPLLTADSPINLEIVIPTKKIQLRTDQGKVSQILRNLISNAIKFTDAGEVRLDMHECADGHVEFVVRDSGLGISPEHQDLIFQDFTQIESKSQSLHKGTGLGLPLSRKLARLLGGDLTVESQYGKGSVFRLKLPPHFEGAETGVLISHAPAETSVGGGGNSFRVLIVDDDEASRYVIRNMISQELNVNVREARDGREAQALTLTWRPDLILLDLTMPDVDGFEFLNWKAGRTELRDVAVIVNTAKALSESEILSLERLNVPSLSKKRLDYQKALNELRAALKKAGFDYLEEKRDV